MRNLPRKTIFCTFYSFKGGVGRTISLVNTAVTLARAGKKVIIWDMDIEAPGVQNIPFFKDIKDKISGGFIDLALKFQESEYKKSSIQNLENYLVEHNEFANIQLLPAGNLENDDYGAKYSSIDFSKLFPNDKEEQPGLILFDQICLQLLALAPDFVLIDSRTGYTDIGGVCCYLIPDIVFLVFNYGHQNLSGIRSVYNSLTSEKTRALREKEIKVHLIASMVPTGQFGVLGLKDERTKEWDKYKLDKRIEIGYLPEVALNETIVTEKYPNEPESQSYKDISRILLSESDTLALSEDKAKKSENEVSQSRLVLRMYSEKPFEKKVAELFQKHKLYKKLLEPKGVEYTKYVSKKYYLMMQYWSLKI